MDQIIFMTAADAYTASLENFEAKLRDNRRELKGLIERATKNGEFRVIWDKQLHQIIRTWLQQYGYIVTEKTLNDGERLVWVVSWEHAGEPITPQNPS